MLNKTRKIFSWEIILFFFINLAILTNIFLLLGIIGFGYEIWLSTIVDNFSISISGIVLNQLVNILLSLLVILIIPFCITIKYLSLPFIIWIIQKWSKKEAIVQMIKTIATNYKFQAMVLSVSIFTDIIFSVLGNIMLQFNDFFAYLFYHFLFGGLTGSYLAIFVFLFIRKKYKEFKLKCQEIKSIET